MPPGMLFAAAALLPAMTGSPVAEQARGGVLALALCNGGSVTVPLGGERQGRGTAPCCAKGCHTSDKRRRIDPEQ